MKTVNCIFLFISICLALSSCSQAPITVHRVPANFQDCFKMMENFFSKPPAIQNGFFPENINSLGVLEASYGNTSLIEIQKNTTAKQIAESNSLVKKLLQEPLETDTPLGFTNYLTKDEIALLYKQLANNKVHKDHYCYDPKGTIGFCFGRATIVHMEALVRGVNPDAIKKIWIAGDMKEWGHHVATMVKAEKGWMVIDTNLGSAVSAEKWIDYYKPFKNKNAKDIMVFVTRADRFGPYDTQNYTGINLFNSNTSQYERSADYYRGYFYDYFEALDKERGAVEKFPERK